VLGTVGERFRAGDVVITGSIVQVPLDDAREVTADLDALGAVTLRLVR
jgi:2-keto-4-pentenoate hydratase